MNTKRRDFLKLLTAGTCGAAAHHILSPANKFLAFADPLAGISANPNKVFILFNFSGGVSYNIAPVYHGTFRDRNPTISYGPENSIVMDSTQGIHPSLTALQTLITDGDLALCNLIGAGSYHSRSHDEATRQWQTQNSSIMGAAEGWGARLTSQLESAFGGVSLSGASSLTRGGTNPPRILSSLSSLGEREIFYSSNEALQLQLARTNLLLQGEAPKNVAQEYTLESNKSLQSNIELLKTYASMQINMPETTGLQRKFKDAARMITAGPALNVKFIYIEQGGYDTHSGERTRLAQLLSEFNGAVGPFITYMKSIGRWDDVVIANMSEFTRTMENSSNGTDHGLAGPQLIMGGMVKGGVKTPVPTPDEVGTREFIRATRGTFAQVYAEIVGEFLGLDASKVFNGDIVASPYFDII